MIHQLQTPSLPRAEVTELFGVEAIDVFIRAQASFGKMLSEDRDNDYNAPNFDHASVLDFS